MGVMCSAMDGFFRSALTQSRFTHDCWITLLSVQKPFSWGPAKIEPL
jgi:hypothetical protein